ncbi:unnamed protein product [Ectocarpus sp. 12 AP-2014]
MTNNSPPLAPTAFRDLCMCVRVCMYVRVCVIVFVLAALSYSSLKFFSLASASVNCGRSFKNQIAVHSRENELHRVVPTISRQPGPSGKQGDLGEKCTPSPNSSPFRYHPSPLLMSIPTFSENKIFSNQ